MRAWVDALSGTYPSLRTHAFYFTEIADVLSEFGMPAMPDLRTIHHWMGSLRDDPRQNFAQAKIMAQHCRAGMFERRFAVNMNEMFKLTEDLET